MIFLVQMYFDCLWNVHRTLGPRNRIMLIILCCVVMLPLPVTITTSNTVELSLLLQCMYRLSGLAYIGSER